MCNTTDDCSGHGQCVSHLCVCDQGFEGDRCEYNVATHVHVVQSCHLDVGFDGSILQVLNECMLYNCMCVLRVCLCTGALCVSVSVMAGVGV